MHKQQLRQGRGSNIVRMYVCFKNVDIENFGSVGRGKPNQINHRGVLAQYAFCCDMSSFGVHFVKELANQKNRTHRMYVHDYLLPLVG